MVKFLASGQQIKHEVRRVFTKSSERRVAIVAFVGALADAYLPRPDGLELICWPKAPGTNPKAIRTLIRRGVVVKFAARVHMKVYWSESSGAVVASSNLSTNAYGAGNLHEAGVAIASTAIDIDRLVAKLKPRVVTEAALQRLEREWASEATRMGLKAPKNRADTLPRLAKPSQKKTVVPSCVRDIRRRAIAPIASHSKRGDRAKCGDRLAFLQEE
jgi:phosphatidylserine/phosphatidylglycerophosphate/cardiolipin synthase-like enzyme